MKIPILTFSSVLMKICQIPHVIFQITSQFFFKFCIVLHCHERYILSTFLGQTLYTLPERDQSENVWDIWVLGSKFTKFLSFLKQQIGFSSNFVSLFSVTRHNSSVVFLLWNFIYFQQKEPIKVQVWWNFTWAVKSLKFCTLMGSFCPNHIKFQLKRCRRVIYLPWHWRMMQSFKKNWLVVSNMTWGI